MNVAAWRKELIDYHDKEIVEYIEFGWPVGYHSVTPQQQPMTTTNLQRLTVRMSMHLSLQSLRWVRS